MKPYNHSLEHIKEELILLDLRLEAAVLIFKNSFVTDDQKHLAGIVISDQEVQGLLAPSNSLRNESLNSKPKRNRRKIAKLEGSSGAEDRTTTDQNRLKELLTRIESLNEKINKRKELSQKNKTFLTLDHISSIFSLSSFDYCALMACLAPEIDLKYEKLYAYLQDDITKKRPTLEVILRIIFGSFEDRIKIRESISISPLFKFDIIRTEENQLSIISKPLKLDERVVNYLLGIRYVDRVLDGLTELFHPQSKELASKDHKEEKEVAEITSFRTLKSNLEKYLENDFSGNKDSIKRNSKTSSLIYLIGKDGCGRKTLIKSILREIGFPSPLLILDLSLVKGVSASIDEVFSALKIEALLLNASLYIDNFSALSVEEDDMKNMQIIQKVLWHLNQVSNNGRLIFMAGADEMDGDLITPDSHFFKINTLQVKVPDLTVQDREHLWKFFLQRFGLTFKDDNEVDEVKQVASKFNFIAGQIKDAILTAINISRYSNSRSQSTTGIQLEDLYYACFHVSNRKLGKVSVKMDKDFLLTDIILPPDKKIQLEDIINYVKNKNKVFTEWGFQAKMGLGSGLNILFSGESGTGKTMAAQVIANELRMEIFKIDLSLLVSKYIGETEKNINRIFQEAKTSNALIFFDEADAIFGKRSEIKDAHDRYANIEVSYLLQKLEEHNEIVILASNLKHNIDEAFLRRMHFIVEFPLPNEKERLEIWKHVFPEPFTDFLNRESINLEFLAGQFKTSGAMIRNIALSAAFLAAAESSKIEMKHLVLATKRELEKKGKPILKSDFGVYYDLG